MQNRKGCCIQGPIKHPQALGESVEGLLFLSVFSVESKIIAIDNAERRAVFVPV